MHKKPSTFNVVPPFSGVIVAQLNGNMASDLVHFFKEQFGSTPEVLRKNLSQDPELASLICHLDDPNYEDEQWEPSQNSATFEIIEAFNDVILITMDSAMRDILINYISDYEGEVQKTIWAFRLALENPVGKIQARRDNTSRRPQRDQGRDQGRDYRDRDYQSRPRRYG
jgi:hypothetical protein